MSKLISILPYIWDLAKLDHEREIKQIQTNKNKKKKCQNLKQK